MFESPPRPAKSRTCANEVEPVEKLDAYDELKVKYDTFRRMEEVMKKHGYDEPAKLLRKEMCGGCQLMDMSGDDGPAEIHSKCQKRKRKHKLPDAGIVQNESEVTVYKRAVSDKRGSSSSEDNLGEIPLGNDHYGDTDTQAAVLMNELFVDRRSEQRVEPSPSGREVSKS